MAQFKSNAPFCAVFERDGGVLRHRDVAEGVAAALGYLFRWRFGTPLYAFATFSEEAPPVSGGAGRRANGAVTILLMIFGAILDKDLRDQRGTKPKHEYEYDKLRTTLRRSTRDGDQHLGLLLMLFNPGTVGYLCRFHEMLRDFGTFSLSGRRASCYC